MHYLKEQWPYLLRYLEDLVRRQGVERLVKFPPGVCPAANHPDVLRQLMIALVAIRVERTRQGLKLSRQTMSNWVLRAVEDHLLPVYEELHRQLVSTDGSFGAFMMGVEMSFFSQFSQA